MTANETIIRIVVPDDYPPVFSGSVAEPLLRRLGQVEVHNGRGADQEDELARRVGSAEVALNIRAHARFSERVLAACPRLRLISVWGTGTDHIDLAACRARGISVASTPGVNANAVAEHTLALMFAILRRLLALDHEVRTGGWPRATLAQLEGKTVGIMGLGAIGRRVAMLLAPFGVKLLAASMRPDDGRAAAVGARAVTIDDVLRESDLISLHLRVTPETTAILNRERIALMKPTAFLVNTARGRLIDENALVDALAHHRLAGAALDVFHDEPIPANHPLLALPNVVLTPHIAGNTPEVIASGLKQAVHNIEQFLASERPMLSAEYVAQLLAELGFTHAVTVPDSTIGRWDRAIEAAGIRVVRVCREGEAWAIAGGLHLGGATPLVLIQCTGLFESGDALRNIVHDWKLPIYSVVGYRSYLNQETLPGDTCLVFTEPILEAWKLDYKLITSDDQLAEMRTHALACRSAGKAGVALIAEGRA